MMLFVFLNISILIILATLDLNGTELLILVECVFQIKILLVKLDIYLTIIQDNVIFVMMDTLML